MLSRLGKVLAVTLPVALTGMLGGAQPAECISCLDQNNWVCCSPDSDECDAFLPNYCNDVGGPFEPECGWT